MRRNIPSTRAGWSPIRGWISPVRDYDEHFAEEHVALFQCPAFRPQGPGPYFVGPLARYNLNFDRLTPLAREAATEAGLGPECRNPFQSIIVRAVETLYAVDEALGIIEAYERPEQPALKVAPRAGVGYAATEAPRGLLYHRYRLDEQGVIQEAKIVPPTSQNQKIIETGPAAVRGASVSICRMTSSPGSANNWCATTTRASPAPPIS